MRGRTGAVLLVELARQEHAFCLSRSLCLFGWFKQAKQNLEVVLRLSVVRGYAKVRITEPQ